MRILLFILVVLAAGICSEKPAEAQSGGCAYLNGGGHDGGRECGFATLQQCLAEVRGVGGNCSPSPYYEPPRQRYRSGYRY